MRGQIRLPAPPDVTIVSITDQFSSARFYLSVFYDLAKNNDRFSRCIFPSCYQEGDLEGIYLPQSNVFFLINAESSERTINMKRFLSPQQITLYREDIRRAMKLRNSMQEQACAVLANAGRFHFALEKLYGDAMDFSQKEEFTKKLIKRAISYLSPGVDSSVFL